MERAEQKSRNRRVLLILIGVMALLYAAAVITILVKN
jgi:hypothetical protein